MARCVEEPLDWLLDQLHRKVPIFDKVGGIHTALLFETPQVTRIRDAKLGLFYYVLLLGVWGYILYTVVDTLNFLETAAPLVSGQIVVRPPTKPGCRERSRNNPCKRDFASFETMAYCCDAECKYPDNIKTGRGVLLKDACWCPVSTDEAMVELAGPGVRAQQSKASGLENADGADGAPPDGAQRSFPCMVYGTQASTESHAQSTFVKTFESYWYEAINPNCNIETGVCEVLWMNMHGIGNVTNRFVADIDRYKATIKHSLSCPLFGFDMPSTEMEGFLYVGPMKGMESSVRQHNVCREADSALDSPWNGSPTDSAPCYIKPPEEGVNGDMYDLRTLLAAADIDLDMPSSRFILNRQPDPHKSLRENGFTMQIVTVYFNSWPWYGLLPKPRYYYKVKARPHSGYSRVSFLPIGTSDDAAKSMQYGSTGDVLNARVVSMSRGLFISFKSDGYICRFSFMRLSIILTTALMLMSLATQFVTYVARFLMQWSTYYSLMIYETSGDFGRLRDISEMSDDALVEALEQKGRPTGGTREERVMLLLHCEETDAANMGYAGTMGYTESSHKHGGERTMGHTGSMGQVRAATMQSVKTDDSDERTPLVQMDVEQGANTRTGAAASSSSRGDPLGALLADSR